MNEKTYVMILILIVNAIIIIFKMLHTGLLHYTLYISYTPITVNIQLTKFKT